MSRFGAFSFVAAAALAATVNAQTSTTPNATSSTTPVSTTTAAASTTITATSTTTAPASTTTTPAPTASPFAYPTPNATYTEAKTFQMAYHPGPNRFNGVNNSIFVVQIDWGTLRATTDATRAMTGLSTTFVAGYGLGKASNVEVTPMVSQFNYPTGMSPYPQYAALRRASPRAHVPGDTDWVGVFVLNYVGHSIQFVNFERGANVTLVAGTNTTTSGTTNGVGLDARFNNPYRMEGAVLPMAVPTWGMLIADYSNMCIRQAVPTGGGMGSLQTMQLSVTTFFGACNATWPTDVTTGLNAIIAGPTAITLSTVFSKTNVPTIALISEDWYRFSMVTPLWPAEARFLSVLGADDVAADYVTIRLLSMPNPSTATLELYVGYNGGRTVNAVTIPLAQDGKGNISLSGNTTITPYFTAGGNSNNYYSWALVPNSNGTLLVAGNTAAYNVYQLPGSYPAMGAPRFPRTVTQTLVCVSARDCSGRGNATGMYPNCKCACNSRYNSTANCAVADPCTAALDCGGRGIASGTFPTCQCATTTAQGTNFTNTTKAVVSVTPLPMKSSVGSVAPVAAVLATVVTMLL